MFDKTFSEMMAVDVAPYVKKRDGADYLPWASCKKLLHDNGAETVMFWPCAGPDGSTLRHSDACFEDKNGVKNRCYEVCVHIQVDALEWDTVYPVLNGNNPVKDNSMSQLRVHNAIRRAFVKGVAERTGLGFSLWLSDDDLAQDDWEDLSRHSLAKCKQRLEETITEKIKQFGSLTALCARIDRSEEEVRGMLTSYYKALARLEKDVKEARP